MLQKVKNHLPISVRKMIFYFWAGGISCAFSSMQSFASHTLPYAFQDNCLPLFFCKSIVYYAYRYRCPRIFRSTNKACAFK